MRNGKLGEVFGNRDFRLLWAGEGISLLGDQFYMIALPWLVLKLTGNAFAIGTVLALVAIPRAIFMLVGGALTDRLSPRVIMLGSNVCRMVLVATLSLLTVTGLIQLWMLYTFALLFGLADAFFFPAQSAIIPRLLGADRLQTGNAVIQGTAQLSVFLGPVLAGTLIALLDGGGAGSLTATGARMATGPAVADIWGIGVAFMIDAASFLASAASLLMIKLPAAAPAETDTGAPAGLFSSIGQGLTAVWKDKTLRYYFGLIAVVNLLMTGPISVGIPVLADSRYAGGAAAFGAILSAFGGGSLVGVIVAGVRRRPAARRFPLIMLGLTGSMGIGLTLLGLLTSTVPAAVVAALMGLGQGYVVVQFVTWLQLRTAPQMLGRMMSVLLFAVVGLSPLSSTIAGALIQWNVVAVMVGAGILMFAVVGFAALSPSVWRLGNEEVTPAGAAAGANGAGGAPSAAGTGVAAGGQPATVTALQRFDTAEVPQLAA